MERTEHLENENQPSRTDWLCTDSELYLLAGMLGSRGLVGVADPFPGYLAEEVQEKVAELRDHLLARGGLVGTSDSFTLDESLVPWLQTIAFAKTVYWITDNGSAAPWQGHVYVGDELVVAKAAADASGQSRVYTMGTPEEARSAVLARFALADEAALPFATVMISQASCEQAVALSRSGNGSAELQALIACFAEEGLSEAHADALARSFAEPLHLGQWVRMEPVVGGWNVRDLGFCCSEQGHWLLSFVTRGEKRFVEFRPASGGEVKQALAEFSQVTETSQV